MSGLSPRSPSRDRLAVTLSMTRDCWVSATVDGQKQFEEILKPGDERSFDVANELVLTVGDAGAVRMTINGVEARPLGKSGEVVTIRLNPATARPSCRPGERSDTAARLLPAGRSGARRADAGRRRRDRPPGVRAGRDSRPAPAHVGRGQKVAATASVLAASSCRTPNATSPCAFARAPPCTPSLVRAPPRWRSISAGRAPCPGLHDRAACRPEIQPLDLRQLLFHRQHGKLHHRRRFRRSCARNSLQGRVFKTSWGSSHARRATATPQRSAAKAR